MSRPLPLILFLSLATVQAQEPPPPGLRGTVTDPSGAAVPGAIVQLRGPRGQQRGKTGPTGQYSFPSLAPGKYQVRIVAKGFSAAQKTDFVIDHSTVFDARLVIQGEKQTINVEDEIGRISAEPGSGGGAVVMRQRQIAALSDDPDELALQLQALAGPAPGPDGGQVYIDGFTGGSLPPKSSIREVRINSNPFSPEYDRPGFARVDVFTKPGSDSLRGQAFAQYTGRGLNARNPLLALSGGPPYGARMYGLDISGPLARSKASFTIDLEHRQIGENAFILATTIDSDLNPLKINQAVAAPQSRTAISPRLDYAISARNTLVARYQDLRIGLDNLGAGDFNLASRAYNEWQSEQTAQITETAVIGPRAVSETRFQYLCSTVRDNVDNPGPAIDVQGAFAAGGATAGNSHNTTGSQELANTSTYTKGSQTLKWGGRARRSRLADTSLANFAGTFTFFTLAQYRQTLALQQAGFTGEQMVQLGAGPSQFSLNAGTPAATVSQADAGLFLNDDWRARANLTLSFGLRYETQGNLADRSDVAPRFAIAWGLDARPRRPAKTVVRAGAGTFYDRIPITVTLNRLRYNGAAQQSFLILNPVFFPAIPPAGVLETSQQPQQLRPVSSFIRSPRLYQTSVGIERQFNQSSRLTLTWIHSRGVHLLNARNINAPIGGLYPYLDPSIRLLTESTGLSRINQVIANSNINYKKLFLFGYYSLSYGMDNNEGTPADPYNLHAEWGPSTYGDVRHRVALGSTIPSPLGLSVSPFLVANSGIPYNITTGLDPDSTGYPAARPALLPFVAAPACQGGSLVYAPAVGCFDLKPAGGTPAIGRNFGRGPAAVNVALRISKTWAFGREGQTGPANRGGSSDHGGGNGPPAGMFASNTGRRYNLTLSASTLNALNHPNYAPPNGDLSSPYFGQYRSLGGLMVMNHGGAPSTYNRKIDLQLRFTF